MTLELKIPPPLVMLVTALLMWLASAVVPFLGLALPWRWPVVVVLGCAAFATAGAGVLAFVRARTTVNPHTPHASVTLVATGVYRLTRNPMYLGLLMLLVAWGVYLANLLALALLPLFVLYLNRFQIGPEERALATKFGAAYASYQASVRRWL